MQSTEPLSIDVGRAEPLAEFVRKHRFQRNEALAKIKQRYKQIRAENPPGSALILVHAPFPNVPVKTRDSELDKRNAPTGQACGKSDLLRLIKEELEGERECKIIDFLSVRKHPEKDFFDQFVAELMPNMSGASGTRIGLAQYQDLAFSIVKRTSLFISYAAPSFFTLLGVAGVLNTIKFWLDPKNQPVVGALASWFEHHAIEVWTLSALAFLVWLLYTYGQVQRDKKEGGSWKDSWRVRSKEDIRQEQRQSFRSNPDRLLDSFKRSGRTLVVLMDDVDVLNAYSFQGFLEFYERATQTNGASLFVVLGYNPRNPRLWTVENNAIRNRLEEPDVLKGAIALTPLTTTDVKGFLWQYYKNPQIEELVRNIQQGYPEAVTNPGLILSYFESKDENKRNSVNDADVFELSPEAVRADFQRFLKHDQQIATDIIETVAQQEHGEECLEFLKYLLAFKSDRVQNEHFKRAVGIKPEAFNCAVKLLQSGKINLLKLTTTDSPGVLEFREPYLRTLLQVNWREWSPEPYCTQILKGLHENTRTRDNPEIALESSPSQLAIDVLWRQGEYYYNYFGKSDAGYALRFYGLGGGGALQKWLELWRQSESDDLWNLIEWKSDARNNPYDKTTRKQYPPFAFAPELVLTTGRLYWMSGDFETAKQIWDHDWPEIKNRLPATEDRTLRTRVIMANLNIRVALAEMLYQQGGAGDWNRAAEICRSVLEQKLPESEFVDRKLLHKARALLAVLTHYQKNGAGNVVRPYLFLRSTIDLEGLRSAADAVSSLQLDRLGVLHVLADACWTMLFPWENRLPLSLNVDELPNFSISTEIVTEFENALEEQIKSLEAISIQRRKEEAHFRPESRVQEADLLFHEGLFLFQRARHFCLKAYLELKQDEKLITSKSSAKAQARYDCYYGTANRLSDFCIRSLLSHVAPSGIGDCLDEFEKLRSNNQTVHFQETRGRTILEKLYKKGWEGILEAASTQLRLAETVYRRVGSKPGLAAISFAKALISYEFSVEPSTAATAAEWVEKMERFLRQGEDRLGWQMDALRARLTLAIWASHVDIPRAAGEYEEAEAWVTPGRLGLPQALSAEINFNIGELSARPEYPVKSQRDIVRSLKTALDHFEKLGEHCPYIESAHVSGRIVEIHWWLAELYRRMSWETDRVIAKEMREQAIAECNLTIKSARGLSGEKYWQSMARMTLGGLLWREEKAWEALQEFEKARKYLAGDPSNEGSLLQVLEVLLSVALYGRSDEPTWEEERKAASQHFTVLVSIASRWLDRIDELGSFERWVLQRACQLVSKVLSNDSMGKRDDDPDGALYWLNKSFDLLLGLGLPGQAILLDNLIQPLYHKSNNPEGLLKHEMRIRQAARKLDARREKIPREVARILRRCEGLSGSMESEHSNTKREYLNAAKTYWNKDMPDIQLAIEALENGRKLINRQHLEEIDPEILDELRVCYYHQGDSNGVAAAEEEKLTLDSIMQSRDFLLLAEHYQKTGGDYTWALQMAASAEVENPYSSRAREKLEEFDGTPLESVAITAEAEKRAS